MEPFWPEPRRAGGTLLRPEGRPNGNRVDVRRVEAGMNVLASLALFCFAGLVSSSAYALGLLG
jgi:hypothetical protein